MKKLFLVLACFATIATSCTDSKNNFAFNKSEYIKIPTDSIHQKKGKDQFQNPYKATSFYYKHGEYEMEIPADGSEKPLEIYFKEKEKRGYSISINPFNRTEIVLYSLMYDIRVKKTNGDVIFDIKSSYVEKNLPYLQSEYKNNRIR